MKGDREAAIDRKKAEQYQRAQPIANAGIDHA